MTKPSIAVLHDTLTRQLLHHARLAGIVITDEQARDIAAQQCYGVTEWICDNDKETQNGPDSQRQRWR